MTSVPGSDTLLWSDEQTRFYLQLRVEEKLKDNVRNQIVNETGRKTIIDKFYDAFGERHAWAKFRNKFNTCKKQYNTVKRLTHNRTGLGYHPNGSIKMTDDWWDGLCKEWPGARKIKDKPVPNSDLMEQVFGAVHVSGAEGWSAQQGENELDNMDLDDDDDVASEARQSNSTNRETDVPSASNGPRASNATSASNGPRASNATSASNGPRDSNAPSASNVSKSKRKRREKEAVAEVLSHKNSLIESHPDLCCSQLKTMRVLNSLSSIRMWSPLYKAAYKYLEEATTHRQTFLSYEEDENKILYLEEETGLSRYICNGTESLDVFALLTEDDDDLLLEEFYGVTNHSLPREIQRTNRGGGWRRVQRLMFESEKQCFDILRMNQGTFINLCSRLAEYYKLEESCHVYHEESVAMFVEMVSQDVTVRVLAERYQRSLDTVKRKLDDVLSALLKLAADIVKPSRGEFTSPSPVLVNDDRYWPFFEDCIGALDGTHISVRPPTDNAEPFRGRKGEPTINVLAICNLNMRFIYAYVGVPGRAHDTKVLTHCATREPFFPHPPDGKYYLVDSGYPTRTGYLGPHRKTRYHLDQFSRGGPPTSTRELFNRKHAGLRSVIERTFGVWKAKWRILDRKHPKYELKKWVKLVTATIALHNFIRDSEYEDRDFTHWETVNVYEHHGDQAEEEVEHTLYFPAGDRAMEIQRDIITDKIARGRQLPY